MKWLCALIVGAVCLVPLNAVAWWQSVPQQTVGTAPVTFAITFGSSQEDATSQTSYSIASVGFGSADPNRFEVVVVCIRSASAIATPTVTIGGTAATKVVEHISAAGPATYSALFQVPTLVPSGTTATVAISGFGAAAARAAVQGYSVVTSTSALPSGAAVSALTASTTIDSGSITVPTNGMAIMAMCSGSNLVPSSISAPAANTSLDHNAIIGASTSSSFSGHDTIARSGSTTYTFQAAAGTTGGGTAGVVAAWAP